MKTAWCFGGGCFCCHQVPVWVTAPGGSGWVYQCAVCFYLLQRNPWDWTLQLSGPYAGKQGQFSSWEGHAHFIPCVPCPSSSWGWVRPLVIHGLVPPAALVPAPVPPAGSRRSWSSAGRGPEAAPEHWPSRALGLCQVSPILHGTGGGTSAVFEERDKKTEY